MTAIVVFINYGCLYLAAIQPVPQELRHQSFADGHVPEGGFWLSASAVDQVWQQLKAKGLVPWHYITPATVHGISKAKRHQGIIWPVGLVDLTSAANPGKPIPSRAELEALKEKLLKVISA